MPRIGRWASGASKWLIDLHMPSAPIHAEAVRTLRHSAARGWCSRPPQRPQPAQRKRQTVLSARSGPNASTIAVHRGAMHTTVPSNFRPVVAQNPIAPLSVARFWADVRTLQSVFDHQSLSKTTIINLGAYALF